MSGMSRILEPSDAASVFSGYRFVSAKGPLIPEILKLPEILIQTDKLHGEGQVRSGSGDSKRSGSGEPYLHDIP